MTRPAVRLGREVSCTFKNRPIHGSRGGGTGGPDPQLKNHKNIGFLSNSGLDPLKDHKATKPALNVGTSSARRRITI